MGALRTIAVIACLVHAVPLRAQENIDPPAAAPADFSHVVGRFRIASSADSAEVEVEQPLTFKVQVIGQGPEKYQPARKTLQVFPEELSADFHVEAVAVEDRALPEKGLWEFVYRLRPKREDVARIPALKLVYFDPRSRRFQSSFADEIPITVTPRVPPTPAELKLKIVPAPASFYETRPLAEMLTNDSPWPRPGGWLLALLFTLPPAACLAWQRLWRRRNPTSAERRERRRSRAAALAIAYLENQDADVVRIRAAVADYLRQRFEIAGAELTPLDVAAHLRKAGAGKQVTRSWSEFFQKCDQARFDPAARQEPVGLARDAVRLIHVLEAEPCASR